MRYDYIIDRWKSLDAEFNMSFGTLALKNETIAIYP